ncbi:FG-GAP-like repeat-containing protein [Streptomyces sp. NPDC051219]|uniref:FG-GAP-like repeat-containing protein n=1 Tax=Streptomyces sp. NPDC051219 TaxID=3155283 RepID=UPI00343CDDD6
MPSGVQSSAVSVLDSDAAAAADVRGGAASWVARWWPPKPTASWSVTVRDKATGKVVRTLAGGAARGLVRAVWDGKDASGRLVANGTYTWTLTAKPADGQGAELNTSGTVRLSGGTAVRRDHGGNDGVGDLLSLSPSGALAFRHGTGTGQLAGVTSGAGWPTSVVAVPFGDLNGDRCNDVLVRLASGELRAYRPGCGKALTPGTAYTSLGKVWGQFNVLTSPGDMTGDGRPDLVARQASTGDMYLYAYNGAGELKARGRIGVKRTGYRAVFGAGDLNGDGYGDLLAVDQANALWRYDGTATGTVKPRVAVFGQNWGVGRNTFVGVGDVTGDGRPDLLFRTTAGDLMRVSGRCNGVPRSTEPKTKIASNFNRCNVLLSSGDMTGDGRSDLVARVAATGDLYLYADNGTGGIRPGVKIGAGWKNLTVLAPGDLNGDKTGDTTTTGPAADTRSAAGRGPAMLRGVLPRAVSSIGRAADF